MKVSGEEIGVHLNIALVKTQRSIRIFKRYRTPLQLRYNKMLADKDLPTSDQALLQLEMFALHRIAVLERLRPTLL